MKWTITDIDDTKGCLTATFSNDVYSTTIKKMKAPIYSDSDTLIEYMNSIAQKIEADIPISQAVKAEVTALIGKEHTTEVAVEK